MLPDVDGIEVCRRIRKRLRRADPDADRPRRGRRQDHRARGRRRRLPDEAVQPARARRAREVDSPPRACPSAASSRRSSSSTATSRSTPAAARRASRGEEIQLAPKEFDLLWELLDHRGLVLTRDQLLERVWGYTFAGDTRTVDVHVRQLRRKLGDASPIVTVWGSATRSRPRGTRRSAPSDRGRDAAVAALPAPGALPARRGRRRPRLGGDRAAALPRVRREPSPARRPTTRFAARRRGSTAALSRQAGRTEAALGAAARARDRRQDLLQPRARGIEPFPGQGPAFTPLPKGVLNPNARFGDSGVTFVFRPPGSSTKLLAAGAAAAGREEGVRRDRRRQAEDGAEPALARADRAAADRIRGRRARGGGVRLVLVAPDHDAACCSSPRAADEVAHGNYDVEVPSGGAGEIGVLAERLRRDGLAARRDRRSSSATS